MRQHRIFFLFLLFLVFNPFLNLFSSASTTFQPSPYTMESSYFTSQIITESKFNRYFPDGNISILLAIDNNLMGQGKYFNDSKSAQIMFNFWLTPFGKRVDINFQVKKVTAFIPGSKDSLDISIDKVATDLSWNMADSQDDPAVNGNNYDFLIIYQENYEGGRNRVNAILGNTLIIAHVQPGSWTSRQLILLHEVGHIFGAEHEANGTIPPEWYGSADSSIIDYDDLEILYDEGWNKSEMPIDDHNFEIINSTRYRFDKNDADLDGLPNYYENRYELNPCDNDSSLDSDDDGLTNWEEYIYGTHPLLSDSDGDSFSDWAELLFESSPLNATEKPIIPSPVIFSLSPNKLFQINQPISLQWRGTASIRDFYTIYQNNTEILTEAWSSELIEVDLDEVKAGNWNFSCKVYDKNGHSSLASIWITVSKDKSIDVEVLFSLLSLFALVIIFRKNYFNK